MSKVLDLKFEVSLEDQISESLDLESLFHIVREVLEFATVLAHNHLKGEHQQLPKPSLINFHSPMQILKKILCKMGFTNGNQEDSKYPVQASILLEDLLPKSKYSPGTRVLLTLATFALKYGEFWFYLRTWNQFGNVTGAILIGERHKELIQLNDMVKKTLEFIDQIIKVDSILISVNDVRVLPDIEATLLLLQNCYDIAIQTIVDCTVHFAALTNPRDFRTVKLHISLQNSELRNLQEELKRREAICLQQIEGEKKYLQLVSIFERPSGIRELISTFTYSNSGQQMLFDCCSKKMVTVDEVVNGSKIFLFISNLEINDDDISHLNGIYEQLKGNFEHNIIWIPAVELWESGKMQTFEDLKKKMRWYTVVNDTYLKDIIRYAKEQWLFNYKPLIVVIDERGSLNCRVEFEEIKNVELKMPPFCKQAYPLVDLSPMVTTVEQGNYTFIYGGTDENWLLEFRKCVDNVPQYADISVKGIYLAGKGKCDEFWATMRILLRKSWENKLFSNYNAIVKLLSLKNETSWAMLLKGFNVFVSGRGNTMKDALESFEWKKNFGERKFGDRFLDLHKEKEKDVALLCVSSEDNSSFCLLHRQLKCHCDCTMVTTRRSSHGIRIVNSRL